MKARPRRAGSVFSNIELWRLRLRARGILLCVDLVSELVDSLMDKMVILGGRGLGMGRGWGGAFYVPIYMCGRVGVYISPPI